MPPSGSVVTLARRMAACLVGHLESRAMVPRRRMVNGLALSRGRRVLRLKTYEDC